MRKSIDANRMFEVQWNSILLRSVAADHHLAGFMRTRIHKRFPAKHVSGLLIERDLGVGICMNKEVGLNTVPIKHSNKNCLCASDSSRSSGSDPSINICSWLPQSAISRPV